MKKIWTMGELLVEVMRPEPDMPLGKPGQFLGPYPSGAPAIFIDTVARLGHGGGIVGGVGRDEFGACIVGRLKEHGVDCTHVTEFDQGTTAVAFVNYFRDGSRKFIYHFDNTPAVWARFPSNLLQAEQLPGVFHIMGCSLMANQDFRKRIIQAASALVSKGVKLSFDPNVRPELMEKTLMRDILDEVIAMTTVLLPGEQELGLLSSEASTGGRVRDLFSRNQGLELIVVKRGKAGCTVYTRSGETAVPAYPVKEVDPTGAGDCFDAGFLCGVQENRPPEECARIAAVAGALNAAAFGPMEGRISRSDVLERIQSFSS